MKHYNITFPIYIIISILSLYQLEGQVYSKGRITDTIKCLNHQDQSYSLYLPSGDKEKTRWPVIMIFDPAGQGIIALKAFRQAAEKYGYILACSHNARNGPLNNNFSAAGYLLTDLAKRFSLDEKRIYVAGFSGGSRVALALASSNNFIAGVIGCGAGLPGDKSLYPKEGSSFVYYGIAGNRDMNWLEMSDLMTFFNNNTPVIPYLRTFDGGHQWPSPEILQEAVEWLGLQAMKKKIIVADTTYIAFCSNKIRTLINNLTAAGNKYDAARYMQYAIRDFSGGQTARDLTGSLAALEQSKDYIQSDREWATIASLERSMNEKYMSSIGKIVYSGSVSDTAASWWKREIGSLILMKDKGYPHKSQMASRLLNFISILCSEQGTSYYRQKQYDL